MLAKQSKSQHVTPYPGGKHMRSIEDRTGVNGCMTLKGRNFENWSANIASPFTKRLEKVGAFTTISGMSLEWLI